MGEGGRGGGVTLIQTKQKRAAREQRNKYKPRTETKTERRTTPSNQTRWQAGGFSAIGGMMIQSDFHIFQGVETTN